jgi:hypothetical protein
MPKGPSYLLAVSVVVVGAAVGLLVVLPEE